MLILAILPAALAVSPMDRDDAWRARYLPDPQVAWSQSITIGFGTGHFYAHDPVAGGVHLSIQALGAAILAGGLAQKGNGTAAISAGALIFIGDRIIDAVTAPLAAHRFRARRGHDEMED
jgi:hypothetical protein